jgi:predicted transcriptional regulator
MYRLAVPMDEIIEALEREIIEENEEMLNSISRLKTYS